MSDISSGMSMINTTEGMRENFVKSWSPTTRYSFIPTGTYLPRSAEATG